MRNELACGGLRQYDERLRVPVIREGPLPGLPSQPDECFRREVLDTINRYNLPSQEDVDRAWKEHDEIWGRSVIEEINQTWANDVFEEIAVPAVPAVPVSQDPKVVKTQMVPAYITFLTIERTLDYYRSRSDRDPTEILLHPESLLEIPPACFLHRVKDLRGARFADLPITPSRHVPVGEVGVR